MRISILLPHLRTYGGILRMLNIADRARAIGHDVTIYHSDSAEFFENSHEHLVYVFPEQYEEVHRVRAKHLYYYNLNLYNKNLLLIPTWIGFFLRRFFAVRRAYYIRKAVMDTRAKILVNCTDSAVWLKTHLGIDATPILGAVNQDIFYPDAPTKPDHRITILYLGSPKYWKGSHDVKQAFSRVQKALPDAQLESYYEKEIPQHKLVEIYNSADVFVDAQIYAGWNNPIAEAMSCKVPVVCYDIGPNRDIALHERTALLVSPKRWDLLADAVLRILRDGSLRERLVDEAFNNIRSFTWEKTTSDLLNIFIHANR